MQATGFGTAVLPIPPTAPQQVTSSITPNVYGSWFSLGNAATVPLWLTGIFVATIADFGAGHLNVAVGPSGGQVEVLQIPIAGILVEEYQPVRAWVAVPIGSFVWARASREVANIRTAVVAALVIAQSDVMGLG